MEVAQARRAGRPAWINVRTALGLFLFAVALVGGNRILAAADETTDLWVAARDLPQDAVLGPGDLEPAPVKLPERLEAGYVAAAVPVYGQTLTRPLRAGEILATGWLARAASPASARSITLPVEAEHAVGGELEPGDRVDVLVTFDAENVRARTVVLARAVEVLDVVETGALAFGESALVGITLAVSPEQAPRLAFATRTGVVDVARVDGPISSSDKSATVRSGDFP